MSFIYEFVSIRSPSYICTCPSVTLLSLKQRPYAHPSTFVNLCICIYIYMCVHVSITWTSCLSFSDNHVIALGSAEPKKKVAFSDMQ